METIIIVTIVIALAYDFLNGMNDAANSIATVVATRVLTPGMPSSILLQFGYLDRKLVAL
jgi:phosphate/sulfate permease